MRQARWSEAVLTLREAASQPMARAAVLHNLAYALERLGHLDEAREALAEAARRGGTEDPRTRISLGVLALKRGDLAEADETLASARPLFGKRVPPPAWFHYVGARRGAARRSRSGASRW